MKFNEQVNYETSNSEIHEVCTAHSWSTNYQFYRFSFRSSERARALTHLKVSPRNDCHIKNTEMDNPV
jgi:hypothetical protein